MLFTQKKGIQWQGDLPSSVSSLKTSLLKDFLCKQFWMQMCVTELRIYAEFLKISTLAIKCPEYPGGFGQGNQNCVEMCVATEATGGL